MILDHTYHGIAHPLDGRGSVRLTAPQTISGAFRRIERRGSRVILGNGEKPERCWAVDLFSPNLKRMVT